MTASYHQVSSALLKRNRAFTLIELLTVIAIIGILAAIIIPTVGRVRTTAATATSSSNLRQWGMAALTFSQDYKDRLPPCLLVNYGDNAEAAKSISAQLGIPLNSSWDRVLARYVGLDPKTVPGQGQEGIFRHPRDAQQEDTANPKRARRTYAMANRGDTNDMIGRRGGFSERISKIPNPSKTIFMTERPNSRPTSNDPSTAFTSSNADINNPQTQQFANQRDLNGGNKFNYLFADGSVRLLDPQDTIGTGTLDAPKGMWTVIDGD